jgi:ribosomal protein S1
VADPRDAVQVGQIVKVKVLEVDYQRERIGLSIKALQPVPAQPARNAAGSVSRQAPPPRPPKPSATIDDLMRKFKRD